MTDSQQYPPRYRGRIAPSPTGHLHLGHARTFWTAQERTRQAHGTLILRNDDLDRERVRPEFVTCMIEDLRWFGLEWGEGPLNQSDRLPRYRAALERLRVRGLVYPCTCSRKDILASARAPHAADDQEPHYPGTCRQRNLSSVGDRKFCWRFRVPDGERISFNDLRFGQQQFVAGRDFADFVVWRQDDVPAYQLACVVDDHEMCITEVVRGSDLLLSTARQILLYRALRTHPPSFYHCPLMTDPSGARLAKRHDALSLRALRRAGADPGKLREDWVDSLQM